MIRSHGETLKLESLNEFDSNASSLESLINLIMTEKVFHRLSHHWMQKKIGKYIFSRYLSKNKYQTKNENNFIDFLAELDVSLTKLKINLINNDIELHTEYKDNKLVIYKIISKLNLCFIIEGIISAASSYYEVSYECKHSYCFHNNQCDNCYLEVIKI